MKKQRIIIFILFSVLVGSVSAAEKKQQSLGVLDFQYFKKEKPQPMSARSKAVSMALMNEIKNVEYKPSMEEVILKKTAEYISEKKWSDALKVLMTYEPVLTYNKQIANQLIYVSVKLNYFDFASDQLKLAIKETKDQSKHPELLQSLGQVSYLAKNYNEAKSIFMNLQMYKFDVVNSKYLFLISAAQNDLDFAEISLSQISKNDIDYEEYAVALSKLEFSKGLSEKSLLRLKSVIDEQSDGRLARIEYARQLVELNRFEETLQALKNVVDDADTYLMKAYASLKLGDSENYKRYAPHLASKDLTDLLLQKKSYKELYSKQFEVQGGIDGFVVKSLRDKVENSVLAYISKPEFKDVSQMRKELQSISQPIRLPASLEFKNK